MKEVSAITILMLVLLEKEEVTLSQLYRMSDIAKEKGFFLMVSYKEIMEAIEKYSDFFALSASVGESAVKRALNSDKLFNKSNLLKKFTPGLTDEDREKLKEMF